MKSRLVALTVALSLWAAAIGYRLYAVQVTSHQVYAERAAGQQHRVIAVHPPRGTLYDARGRTLAVSVSVRSACLFPPEMENVEEALDRIVPLVAVDRATLRQRISGDRRFAWVERLLDPQRAAALAALEIPGLGFIEESKRFYPLGELAGPVLGFVGIDHNGLAGLEAEYERAVAGRPIRRTVLRDGLRGSAIAPGLSLEDAERGSDLHLTIDATVQHVVERELADAVGRHHAKSGTAVVMDPKTGAILAMASHPAFDPNRFDRAPRQNWRNRAVQDSYEPGSTFKVVTAAAALEGNVIDPVDIIDCEMGAIQLQRARIRDHHPFGLLTFREVIAKSSNVGAIKAGLLAGREPLYRRLRAFGFGESTGVDVPGEEIGLVWPLERWSLHADAYASIGQGLSVTALQLTRAFAAVANGGDLLEPYVVAAIGSSAGIESTGPRPVVVRRVASAATVRTLVRLLEAVVEEGTGRAAAVPGYSVAGKTGTAQKAEPGKGYYEDRHVASFAGFAPSRDPAIVAVVVLDEPGPRYHGGEVAAPVFGAIARQVLPYLGVVPDRQEPAPRMAQMEGPALPTAAVARGERAQRVQRAVEEGLMPDLVGLTARQALAVSSRLGLAARLHGSGWVERQRPAPGVQLAPTSRTLDLWLASG